MKTVINTTAVTITTGWTEEAAFILRPEPLAAGNWESQEEGGRGKVRGKQRRMEAEVGQYRGDVHPPTNGG